MPPNEIMLALKLKKNQNVMKGPCFEFVSRILTCTLTLRQRLKLLYFSQLLFDEKIIGLMKDELGGQIIK